VVAVAVGGVLVGGVLVGGVLVGGVLVGGVLVGGVLVGGVLVGGVLVGGVLVGGVVGAVLQNGRVMVLVSKVTAPFRASARPITVLPVCTVTDVNAKMLPTKVVLVPRVAELPTWKNTLHAWAPLISMIVLFGAVIRVDPTWKMNTALGSFSPSRVTVPVTPREDSALYTPGAKVCPPMSPDTEASGLRPAASLYAVVRSAWALAATASPA